MSVSIDSFTLTNPNPNSSALFLRRASMALCPSPMSLQWKCLLRPHGVSVVSRTVSPTKLGLGLLPLPPRSLRNRSVFSFASSREESAFSDKVEEEKSDLKVGAEESEEAWKQTLASFKEQALKMQSVSQEAYELYSKKAMVILKETSEQWKVQAEKARNDLSIVAKEISEESKKNLCTAAEISPEPVKDIVETFASSTDDVNELSKMRDFYLGIPYGILLSSGGFLSFMLTGSLSALRFGVILGGVLLALSISSLRSWRRGESFPLALKGQTAIASILFLRETRMLFQEPTIGSLFTAFVSGVMVAFYLYRLALNDGQGKRATGTQN